MLRTILKIFFKKNIAGKSLEMKNMVKDIANMSAISAMKECFSMGKGLVLEPSSIKMKLFMKDIGKMMFFMEKECFTTCKTKVLRNLLVFFVKEISMGMEH